MKETITNILFLFRNKTRRWFNVFEEGKDFDYSKYELVETLNTSNTLLGYEWGEYHPNQPYKYFDDDMVKYEDDVFFIRTQKKPKSFGGIVIPYATGVVRSSNVYMYGYFETEIFFPTGKHQWPAFWLTGAISWPPEIDVVEAYSKDDNYNDYKRFQPNVHYGNGLMIGAVNIPLPKSLFYSSAPIKFGVEWQPDYMKFYYNGYLVKVIYDKKVLESMNQPMRVIINSSVQEYMCASDSVTAFTSPKIYH